MLITEAFITIVGTGGIGCNVLINLVGMGARRFRLIDNDKMLLPNLNRQFLFCIDDEGKYKVDAAKERLLKIEPDCQIETFAKKLTKENAHELLKESDFVVLAVDNLAARLVANEYCVTKNIPFISGGIDDYKGHIQLVNSAKDPCLCCVDPRETEVSAKSNISGIVSWVSSLMSLITIDFLKEPFGYINPGFIVIDGQKLEIMKVWVSKSENCPICGNNKEK